MRTTPLTVIKSLDPIEMWIFLVVRSLCDGRGVVKDIKGGTLTRIAKLANGYRPQPKARVSLNVDVVTRQIRRFAYREIVKQVTPAEIDESQKEAKFLIPVTVEKKYLDLVPDPEGRIPEEVVLSMQARCRELEIQVVQLKQDKRDLKMRVKASMATVKPEFKIKNKDGTPSVRDLDFRRVWCWLILLDVEDALVKIVEREGREPEKKLDFKTLALWHSYYGIDVIEGVLLKFLMNKRLETIKEDAGENWREAITRFLFASFRGEKKQLEKEGVVGKTGKSRMHKPESSTRLRSMGEAEYE